MKSLPLRAEDLTLALNLTLVRTKGQPISAAEFDANFEEIERKLASVDSPLFQGVPRGPIPGANASEDQLATVGWTRELITGSAQQGSTLYAALGAANAFSKPQSAPAAVSDSQLVTLAQLKQRGFEAGDIKYSLWPRSGNSGWISFDSTPLPGPTSPDPNKALYADLFAKIGYTYGGSSALQYFQTPDCRGRVIVGNGASPGLTPRGAGERFGEEAHLLGLNEMVNHTHSYTQLGTILGGAGGSASTVISGANTQNSGLVVNLGQQTPFGIIQPSLVVYMLVKL
jgi:microcystin-dependent protein